MKQYHLPSPIVPAICAMTSGAGLSRPRVAAIPALTPIIPNALPINNFTINVTLQCVIHITQKNIFMVS